MAELETFLHCTEPQIAFMAGYLVGYAVDAGIKYSSTEAMSVARLKESHGIWWARGTAQGKAGFKAFQMAGVENMVMADTVLFRRRRGDRSGARLARRERGAGASHGAARRRNEAHQRGPHHDAAVTMSATQGQPAPAAPALLDLADAF